MEIINRVYSLTPKQASGNALAADSTQGSGDWKNERFVIFDQPPDCTIDFFSLLLILYFGNLFIDRGFKFFRIYDKSFVSRLGYLFCIIICFQ